MNRKLHRFISLALVLCVMTACALCGGAARAASGDDADLEGTDELVETASGLLPTDGTDAGKEETVYVIADAEGTPTRSIVSAWLKNPDGADTLTDKADLSNIRNTKGDETFTQDADGNIVWAAAGSDIYYQGDSDAALPLTVHVSYTLDGQDVTAQELAGASGHLVMTFTYENNTATTREINGETVTVYQPFAAVSCAVLNGDKVTNVEVTNGKLVNLGDQLIVAGVAMPGLKESLGLDELKDADGDPLTIDIPEEVVVSADVTDFSLMTTLTLVENNLLGDLDLDNVDSFDELEGSMDELTDASTQLADGSSDLYDGATALADGAGSLTSGAVELSDGAATLAANMTSLYNGLVTLQNGAVALAGGLDTMQTQVADLPAGTQALLDGAQNLKTALTGQVKPGAEAIQTGAQTVSETLRGTFKTGAAQMQTGADAIAKGARSNDAADPGIYEAAGAIAAGATQVKEGLTNTPDLTGSLSAAAEALAKSTEFNNSVKTALTALASAENLTAEQKTAIQNALGAIEGSNLYLSAVTAGLSGVTMPDTSAAVAAMDAIIAGAAGIQSGAEKIAAGARSGSAEAPGLYEAAGALAAGAEQLATDGSDALATGAEQLAAGVDTMVSGNEGDNLNALIGGLETLNASSQTLVDGVAQLSSGADALNAGAATAVNGAWQLSEGADTLAAGTQTLSSGAQELSDGIGQVVDGASDLMEGMDKFDEEGIQALSDLVKGDAQGFFDRLRAVQELAKEYTSFSGAAEGVSSVVRFVIRTDSIGK